MSRYREQPFHVSKGDRGGWVIDFEGTPICVRSRNNAMLLANLPVELYKATSKDQRPDLDRIEHILALCNEYQLDYSFVAVRQLRAWFKRGER
jgi:hypothetical protein